MKKIQINTDVFNSHSIPIAELAKQSGLSINTVKSIAQGKQRRIDFPVLEKIAKIMNVNPLALLKESDNESDK
jgi:DNA-binding Xre family transcriptional regulator